MVPTEGALANGGAREQRETLLVHAGGALEDLARGRLRRPRVREAEGGSQRG